MKICGQCAQVFDTSGWTCPACGFQPPRRNGFLAHTNATEIDVGGFDPEEFHELVTVEAGSFWFRARNRLIIGALQRYFPDMKNYLEIGCGTGYVLSGVAEAFPSVEITGSEFFGTGLDYTRQRVERAHLSQLDARHLPYEAEFDVIGAFDVLEHIVEDEDVLAEVFRSLRPGGGLALTVPQHPWLWSRQDEQAHHVRRYRVGELREKAERAGFSVLYETSFVSLLFPFMILARRFASKPGSEADAGNELRLPGILNAAFAAVMTLERLLLGAGLRFSFGGSGLLVARKVG